MARRVMHAGASRHAFKFVGSYNLATYERHEYLDPPLTVPPGRYTSIQQAQDAAYVDTKDGVYLINELDFPYE